MAYNGMNTAWIEKQINKRIAAIAARVVLLVLAGILGSLLVINPLVKLGFYNPAAKQRRQAEYADASELELYLNAYSSVFLPYKEIWACTVKDRDFGRYTVTMSAVDHRDKIIMGDRKNQYVYKLEWNQWTTEDVRGLFTQIPGRFEPVYAESTASILPELEKLPDSCIISCSLVLPQAVLPEELRQEGILVDWIWVEQKANQALVGISLWRSIGVTESRLRRSSMTGEELREEFLEELDILLSDTKLLETFGGICKTDGNGGCGIYYDSEKVLREIRDEVAGDDTIRTRRICVTGTKQDVLAYIEQMEVTAVGIDDVRMSQWWD